MDGADRAKTDIVDFCGQSSFKAVQSPFTKGSPFTIIMRHAYIRCQGALNFFVNVDIFGWTLRVLFSSFVLFSHFSKEAVLMVANADKKRPLKNE